MARVLDPNTRFRLSAALTGRNRSTILGKDCTGSRYKRCGGKETSGFLHGSSVLGELGLGFTSSQLESKINIVRFGLVGVRETNPNDYPGARALQIKFGYKILLGKVKEGWI